MRSFVPVATAAAALALVACGSEIAVQGELSTFSAFGASAPRVDLLLTIDDSRSMADKQALLAAAIPDLIGAYVAPRCYADADDTLAPTQPGPTEACESGYHRRHPPVTDLHVGVITSSLGSLGASTCGGAKQDRRAHLVSDTPSGSSAPTYEGQGFLAWDPGGVLSPVGVSDASALGATLSDMVKGVGEEGCGFEMPLEATVRFLVDPMPWQTLEKAPPEGPYSPTTKVGTDDALLAQRAAFLRDDSILVVLVLSDENDCSFEVGAQGYSVMNPDGFYKSASICATTPSDKCCYSCGLPPPVGCQPDPVCAGLPKYDTAAGEDSVNLRCWHQQQRYGVQFLYPTARYVNAFTQTTIEPERNTLDASGSGPSGSVAVTNPIFAGSRTPKEVFVGTLTGVPWQPLAQQDENGQPTRLKTPSALASEQFTVRFVGSPDSFIEPTEPIMQEHYLPRGVAADAPNGGDRTIDPAAPGDLQYACTFPLASPVPASIECGPGAPADNPICQGTTQIQGKAYPSLRTLSVVDHLAEQGVVGSICPVPNGVGYGPFVDALDTRTSAALVSNCLSASLGADADGRVSCIVVEAIHSDTGQEACDQPGRGPVDADHVAAMKEAKADALAPKGDAAWNSFCEIAQLDGSRKDASSDLARCQTGEALEPGRDGWCYLDRLASPPVGDPSSEAFGRCTRTLRFVNGAAVRPSATAFVACFAP